MSGGRFELGLGAGAFWDAIVGMGGPRRSPGEALAALEGAVAISGCCGVGRGLRFDGEHYAIAAKGAADAFETPKLPHMGASTLGTREVCL